MQSAAGGICGATAGESSRWTDDGAGIGPEDADDEGARRPGARRASTAEGRRDERMDGIDGALINRGEVAVSFMASAKCQFARWCEIIQDAWRIACSFRG